MLQPAYICKRVVFDFGRKFAMGGDLLEYF